jgi:Helicase conserved C-terminal domain
VTSSGAYGRRVETGTLRDTEREAQANLTALLHLCGTGALRCGEKTSRPSAATVRAVAACLAGGDFSPDEPISAFAWPLLLLAGGLASLDGTKLTLTAKGRAALAEPAAGVIRGIWRRWPKYAPIDEFSRIEQIKGQRAAATLSAAGPRRRDACAALSLCPPHEWITVDDLFSEMRNAGLNPAIARSERALWKLYLSDPQYGSLGYDGHNGWSVLQGRYTLAVLLEYAATLGLIDVLITDPAGARDDFQHMWGGDWLDALSRYDGLRAVRLNALGQYVTGSTTTYAAPAPVPAERGIEVLANLDVVATGELAAADRLVLDAYAQRTSDRVWTLSAASLLAASDAGRGTDELAAFLDARAAHGLPSTVRVLLADVDRRVRQVHNLGLRRVVECADAATAALIANDRILRSVCTRLGDRHLMIKEGGELKFRGALRGLGYSLGPA